MVSVDGPGIVSASFSHLGSISNGKYTLVASSGRQMISAPSAAACFVSRAAFATTSSVLSEKCI